MNTYLTIVVDMMVSNMQIEKQNYLIIYFFYLYL